MWVIFQAGGQDFLSFLADKCFYGQRDGGVKLHSVKFRTGTLVTTAVVAGGEEGGTVPPPTQPCPETTATEVARGLR